MFFIRFDGWRFLGCYRISSVGFRGFGALLVIVTEFWNCFFGFSYLDVFGWRRGVPDFGFPGKVAFSYFVRLGFTRIGCYKSYGFQGLR